MKEMIHKKSIGNLIKYTDLVLLLFFRFCKKIQKIINVAMFAVYVFSAVTICVIMCGLLVVSENTLTD